ncbi:hypothetical protein I552_2629 [Mycobacterium xenopi 3993]|nr:hypothetical protein I552_2629 [Mycobacterium xenopi 3993]
MGPPHESPLWHALIVRRDPGTTEVQPRYDNGRTVRFSEAVDPPTSPASQRAMGGHPGAVPATSIRSGRLVVARFAVQPTGLAGRTTGQDRTASMRWYPVVTFWQVSADLTEAERMPRGHGHNYGNTILDGWAAVIPRMAGRARTPSGYVPRSNSQKVLTDPKTDARQQL